MGMSLAHLLTGGRICRPFPSGVDLLQASANGDWPPLDQLGSNVPSRLRKVVEAATQYTDALRPQTVDAFKRLLDRATPAVSFLPSQANDTLVSSDGNWSIATIEKGGRYSVEVRRARRRRNLLGVDSVTAAKARSHVNKLVRQFADGKL
jgi:hypothetical protein